MKVLKWFRYGALSLALLPFLVLPFISSFLESDWLDELPQYMFIIYTILSIIELCKSENKFEPKIMYYCGAAMSTIVLFSPYSLLHKILERYYSQATADTLFATIIWIYNILTILLILVGGIWEIIREYKRLRDDKKILYHLSKIFLLVGIMSFLIFVMSLNIALLELVSYMWSFYHIYSIISRVIWIVLVLSSIGFVIAGITLRIIWFFEEKGKNSNRIETHSDEVIEEQQIN